MQRLNRIMEHWTSDVSILVWGQIYGEFFDIMRLFGHTYKCVCVVLVSRVMGRRRSLPPGKVRY